MDESTASDFIPLDIDFIEQQRQGKTIGKKFVLFKSTASTNNIAWEYATNPIHHGLCVLAESQDEGRGRRGRTWYSEAGKNILASILLLNQPLESEVLTLTAAVATAEAITSFCKLPCRIKWPNDILLNGKKLAGILVEKKTAQKQQHFVIGIGINCNQSGDFFDKHDLHMPATSLSIETGEDIDRNKMVCVLLKQLEQWLTIAHNSRAVLDRWQQLSSLLGQHLTIESDNRRYSGFCRGIDPAKGLIMQLDSGVVQIFHANQASILKA